MNKIFIIAEAGVNHNGDIAIAKKLVDAAKTSGADAIKFQTFKAENIINKLAKKADYQKKTTSENETQYEMLKKYELSREQHKEIVHYCREKMISFLSSAFDLTGIDLLNELGLEIYKIPSGEITNLPYLKKIGSLKKKIILSTGMSELGEIGDALDILINAGTPKENITVLHCNTEYPTPFEDTNLLAMPNIKKTFGVNIGYSDHTIGIEVPIAAVALGATIIEKHLTLDRNMEGPDHKASIEPPELKEMVNAIRNIESALGNGVKKPSDSEMKNRSVARKSIVAATNIARGELFSENNLTTKRPGNGISPMQWYQVIGLRAKRDYKADDLIET